MTPVFANGKLFGLARQCLPPKDYVLPWVAVQMSWKGVLVPVVGKVDTGSFCTLLTFKTAESLGIDHPTDSTKATGICGSATGHPVTYHVHELWVQVGAGVDAILFSVDAGFTEDIGNNLFGCDWLTSVCIALDRNAVYFLRD